MKIQEKETQVIRFNLSEEDKVVLTSCLLSFIPISVLLFNVFDPEERYYFPFLEMGSGYYNISFNNTSPVNKNLQWVVSLGTDRLAAIIYIVCAAIKPDFKKFGFNVWIMYGVYEGSRLIDHFLTYEQTPFREYFGYTLVLFQLYYAVLYHFKSE